MILDPHENRLDYKTLLSPPDENWELDLAVGTSYSLDMQALLGVTVALRSGAGTDSDFLKDKFFVLKELRKTAPRMILFCDAAHIKVPQGKNPFSIPLEQVVFPVKVKKNEGRSMPAFHPKCWILRFRRCVEQNEEPEFSYRVVVLSRNLTFDRSWDLACSLEGKRQGEKASQTPPLCDFLDYLIEQVPDKYSEKAQKLRELQEELSFVHFKTDKRFFEENEKEKFEFLPTGIPGHSTLKSSLKNEHYKDLLIFSPFLSYEVLESFLEKDRFEGNGQRILITRKDSLSKIGSSKLKKMQEDTALQILVLRDRIVEGESDISGGENTDIQNQDIHAKLYFFCKPKESNLFLGSHNATNNAFHHNVEFSLRLKASPLKLNLQRLLDDISGLDHNDAGGYFEKVSLDQLKDIPPAEDSRARMTEVLSGILCCQTEAAAIRKDGVWTVDLRFDEAPAAGFQILVRPLLSDKKENFAHRISFTGLKEHELSEFFVFSLSDSEGSQLERLVKFPVQGLPEGREKALLLSVIRTQEDLNSYLLSLLDDLPIPQPQDQAYDRSKNTGEDRSIRPKLNIPGLYERMLLAATTEDGREKLKIFKDEIQAFSDKGFIPEELQKLNETFKKAMTNYVQDN